MLNMVRSFSYLLTCRCSKFINFSPHLVSDPVTTCTHIMQKEQKLANYVIVSAWRHCWT